MRTVGSVLGGCALVLAVAAGACGGDAGSGGAEGDADARDAPESATPASDPGDAGDAGDAGAAAGSGYAEVDVTDGGSVRGTVRFSGDVPAVRTVTVTGDNAACGSTREVRTVRVGDGGGLADAVVSLTDIRRGRAFDAASAPTLDQRNCRFTPHVLVAPVGGAVRVTNGDPLTHNVHTASFENRSVNRTQPAGLESIELRFDAPEKVRVKCDLHSWMGAWIVVAAHPYHAVTDDAGGFVLRDVPPGTYGVEVWHETLGTRTSTVTVEAGGTAELAVDLAGQG